eukprot:8202019-Pyramimonas_sp.AAC.1
MKGGKRRGLGPLESTAGRGPPETEMADLLQGEVRLAILQDETLALEALENAGRASKDFRPQWFPA